RQAEVVAVAVDELDLPAGRLDRARRRHERVRRAEHGLALDLEVLEGRERRAGPARRRDPGQAVPGAPGELERLRQGAARPLRPVEGAVPELMEPLAVALVEADGKGVDVHG